MELAAALSYDPPLVSFARFAQLVQRLALESSCSCQEVLPFSFQVLALEVQAMLLLAEAREAYNLLALA